MAETKPPADLALDRIDRVVRPLALYLGGIVLVGLVGITVVDVGFRYILNSPILGAGDVAQLLLIIAVTFSIAQSGRTGGQIAVEILGEITSPKITRWTDILVRLMGVVMMAILSLQLFNNGMHAADYGEATSTLLISFGPFFQALAFGTALYGVVLLVEIYVLLRGRVVSHHVGTSGDE